MIGGQVGLSVRVVIDYQNIHLTAHDKYAPKGLPKHETLVHPLHFAHQVLQARRVQRRDQGLDAADATLGSVIVYRGLPSNKHDPKPYQRSQAQKSEWTRDPCVKVSYRPLRYYWNGKSMQYEKTEKGVDVLLALDTVDSIRERVADIVILASHDTDLEPAIESGLKLSLGNGVLCETVGWAGAKVLKPNGPKQWHTNLHGPAFVRSRDRKTY